MNDETHTTAEAEASAVSAAQTLLRALAASGVEDGLADDLAVAVRAAIEGGAAACTFYGGAYEIEEKSRNNPVTAADHASNRAILSVLGAERPDDGILSEESPPPAEERLGGRLWVVDPLDGTKEFIAQNGEFSVMVGLAVDGRTVLGAVQQPAIDRVFVGIVDVGAWTLTAERDANGVQTGWAVESLELDPAASHEGPVRFVRSRSHPDERLTIIAQELGDIEEVISGSVGIKCALVARDAADLYVHPVPFLKEWDTCAPEAVLRGAGGRVTDCAGQPLEYGSPDPRQHGGIFAGTHAAWERARSLVGEVTRSMFDPA